MFASHRRDLIDAQAKESAALKMVITVLADQVEFLRFQLTQRPHMSASLHAVAEGAPPAEDPREEGRKMYLSEQEEEILALNLEGHLTGIDLDRLASEFDLPSLEASE